MDTKPGTDRGGYLLALAILVGAVAVIIAQEKSFQERRQVMLNEDVKRADAFQKAVFDDVAAHRRFCDADRKTE